MWQLSGLQAAMIETLTLPSRLRPVDGRTVTLADMESSINRDGLRRVAVLESDATSPTQLAETRSNGVHCDKRMTNGLSHDMESVELERFAISASSLPTTTTPSSQRSPKDNVFGRAESLRGKWAEDSAIEESNIASRDRFASGGGMTIIKYVMLYSKIRCS